jgi:hypothetical protein
MKITSPAITLQVKEDDEVSEPYRVQEPPRGYADDHPRVS